jgi:predicted double-glycine peptidase
MNRRSTLRSAAALGAALAACALVTPAAAQVRFSGEPAVATVRVMSWRDIPFRTVVRQQHDYSCGSAALATLLTYHYGVQTTEADAFKAMYEKGDQEKIRKVGFSMLDMKHYLADHGLKASGYKMNLDEVAQAKTPVIALINIGVYRHFVVIKGVDPKSVLIGDPALGLKTVPREVFSKMWNGIALALDPPAGASPARFNLASEWSPWSSAPLRGAAMANDSLQTITSNQFLLYQITPVLNIDFRPTGG